MDAQRQNDSAGVEIERWLSTVVESAMARGAGEEEVVVASPDKSRGLTLVQCQRHLYRSQFGADLTAPGQRLVPVSFIEEYVELLGHSPMSDLMKFIRRDVALQIINSGVEAGPQSRQEGSR